MVKKTLLTGTCIMLMLMLGIFVYGGEDDLDSRDDWLHPSQRDVPDEADYYYNDNNFHPGIDHNYLKVYYGEEVEGFNFDYDDVEGFENYIKSFENFVIENVRNGNDDTLREFIFNRNGMYGPISEERIEMIRLVEENKGIEVPEHLSDDLSLVEFMGGVSPGLMALREGKDVPHVTIQDENTARIDNFETRFEDEGIILENFEAEIGQEGNFMYGKSFTMDMKRDGGETISLTSRFTDDGEVEITRIGGRDIDEDTSIEDALGEIPFDGMSEEDIKNIIDQGTRDGEEILRQDERMTLSDAAQRHHQTMRHKFAQEGRSAILGILNSWTSKWLGDFSMRAFAAICGDTMYVSHDRDTRHEGIFGSLRAPGSDYESKLEEEATGKDKPTVVLSGERNQVGENLYRYGATMKLIGNQYDEWSIYLYNSCTKENSYDDYIDSDAENGWTDYGSISLHRYINNHYAGHRGQSMIFDCQEENCRFDQVCVVFESTNIPGSSSDNKEPENLGYGRDPYCVTLTHGEGFFTQGETGSYDC